MRKNYRLKGLLLLFLAFCLSTCKKQSSRTPNPALQDGKEVPIITFRSDRNANALQQHYLAKIQSLKNQPQGILTMCAGDATTQQYGVNRSGTCNSGYSYTLRIDDIEFLNPTKPTSVSVSINGHSFTPTYVGNPTTGYWQYSLSAAYSAIGLSNSSYCTSLSVTIQYYACGGLVNTEILELRPSEACGRTTPSTTSTVNLYSWIPSYWSTQPGSVDLAILIGTCDDCSVILPDYYVFEYKLTTETSYHYVRVAYPDYLDYNLALPSGTYNLKGYDECGTFNGGVISNTGPEVTGSPSTFTIP
ncbi:MAG TPA: hypothetical protein VHD83_15050 [Puia sp.]|nr:hypothetical protein [Puia sp.]